MTWPSPAADLGPLAVYAKGRMSITITAPTTEDDPVVIDAFVALLPLVTVPV